MITVSKHSYALFIFRCGFSPIKIIEEKQKMISANQEPLNNVPYAILLGDSLKSNHPKETFHILRYNFKPVSINQSLYGKLFAEGNLFDDNANTFRVDINFELKNKTISSFGGQFEPKKRQLNTATECVLVFDPSAQSFTIQRVHSSILQLDKNGQKEKKRPRSTVSSSISKKMLPPPFVISGTSNNMSTQATTENGHNLLITPTPTKKLDVDESIFSNENADSSQPKSLFQNDMEEENDDDDEEEEESELEDEKDHKDEIENEDEEELFNILTQSTNSSTNSSAVASERPFIPTSSTLNKYESSDSDISSDSDSSSSVSDESESESS
jgi:hypothetical protein